MCFECTRFYEQCMISGMAECFVLNFNKLCCSLKSVENFTCV